MAHVLDVDPDPDHHRAVVSLLAPRERLIEARLGAVAAAAERIDRRKHAGVHPRVGAADVLPIVPIGTTTIDACRDVAHEVGHRIWTDLQIPVFFYGYGAEWSLADIRAGPAQPALGGPALHPAAGAARVGGRGGGGGGRGGRPPRPSGRRRRARRAGSAAGDGG